MEIHDSDFRRGMRTSLLVGLAVTMLIVVIAGGYWGYWWLARKNNDNQFNVNTHSQGYQAALIQQERDRVSAYDAAVDESQKYNIKQTFCSMYADLTQPPADLVSAQQRICK